jgi:hypothetical protein
VQDVQALVARSQGEEGRLKQPRKPNMKEYLTPEQQRYAVESGIPIAPTKARTSIYPFLSMEVGDSFALNSREFREIVNVRGAIVRFNKEHAPMKFSLRLNRASGEYRCWRLK